ncbi:MAG: alpha/beta fold hydrolase [Burkholderiaceae bacterium]
MRAFGKWMSVIGLVVGGFTGAAIAQPGVESETFHVQSTDPSIRIHVRNKRPANVAKFDENRIVIFVHGATYPSESAFDIALPGGSWLDYVAQRGFDAYFLDVRGYGRSTRPASMDEPPDRNPPFARTADAVADVGAVVDFVRKRRGVERVNLVGWSWGTTIMAGYTAQNNDKVKRLTLYAPLWIIKDAPPIQGFGSYRTVTKDPARSRGANGIPKERVEEISPAAWFEQWWAANLATDPAGAARTPAVLRAPNGVIQDIAEFWAKGKSTYDPAQIRVPTLVILAEWDRDTPPYMAQEVFSRLVNASYRRHVVLREGTHAIVLEKNRMQLIAEIQNFLEGPY